MIHINYSYISLKAFLAICNCSNFFSIISNVLTGLFEKVAKPQSGFNQIFSFGINFKASSVFSIIDWEDSIISVLGFITPRARIEFSFIFSLDNKESSSPARGVENSNAKISGEVSSKSGTSGVYGPLRRILSSLLQYPLQTWRELKTSFT